MIERSRCSIVRPIANALAVSAVLFLGVVPQISETAETDAQQAARRAQYQQDIQDVVLHRASYVDRIVQRWEASARESGRWDQNWHANLQDALSKLSADNLLAADKAESLQEMMTVLADGPRKATIAGFAAGTNALQVQEHAQTQPVLGQISGDLVYTPLTPCRIVDTRNAGGQIGANTTRFFDVDGADFSAQGGSNRSCQIPFGVARAVAMTITVTRPLTGGFLNAWGLGPQPFSSVLNFAAGQTIANSTIVPVIPGGGADFSIFSTASADLVVDVIGYFAAPEATALDCITVSSPVTIVFWNQPIFLDATCSADRTVTGGGHDVPEGSLGIPGVWVSSFPNGNGWRSRVDVQTGDHTSRSAQTFAVCCRIPGR
jgi:hypothetical protein